MTAATDPALDSLVNRLDALSLEPGFLVQREIALSRALHPYLRYADRVPLAPLPEEVELARLYLFADFYPEDGQLSLPEQLRDIVTTHVPEEERLWLDPLHHSYMDLLEVEAVDGAGAEARLTLRSLGDNREFHVEGDPFGLTLQPKQVLLARLVRPARAPAKPVLVGAAVVLAPSVGRALYEGADQWRRELEAGSGAFDLGEWEEFAKRFGYILLWQLAQARLQALLRADEAIRYRTPAGEPFLHALALYDHHEYRVLSEGLAGMEGLEAEAAPALKGTGRETQGEEPEQRWVLREGPAAVVGARLTLTPVQVLVECDSRARLDRVKHQLASTFGYSLHFRGESTTVPAHDLPEVDLATEEQAPVAVVVGPEEEHRLLSGFLESVYLEWVDQPSPALGDQTPRHAAGLPAWREKVGALLDRIEKDDPCLRRTGQRGYDYGILREHVGL